METKWIAVCATITVFASNATASESTSEHVHIAVTGGYRYIVSDGIPNHETGPFPNPGNPNRVQLQYHRFRVPAEPAPARNPTPLSLMPFGVAINGVPFDPGAAEFWKGDRNWQYEALSGKINLGLDAHNAHVQPSGAYHYHGVPTGLLGSLKHAEGMVLLGYAADGFPIYANRAHRSAMDASSDLVALRSSFRLKSGLRPGGPGGAYDGTFVQDYEYVAGGGDLDECNGRTGVTPEYPEGTYYYVITEEFPFVPRSFRGVPDESFQRRGPRGGGNEAQPHPGSRPRPGHRPPPPYREHYGVDSNAVMPPHSPTLPRPGHTPALERLPFGKHKSGLRVGVFSRIKRTRAGTSLGQGVASALQHAEHQYHTS